MVRAELVEMVFPTYPVGIPERNPMFFEKRVYQGSSGKVYPVPFVDQISDTAEPRAYQAAQLENELVRLLLLPEIGGRIHVAQDKTRDDYDIFYRQDSIKPALVGLAGPWVSGGVEFNWPQHHRPGTFMPADVWIEREPSGVRTVWLSEHDPMHRLKGMHGLRLRPNSALIEVRARLFNRTPLARTFLWWANAAVRVHDRYQSFFPPDVRHVADHARRAISTFPRASGPYYGVDYGVRPDACDLTWYQNIPVPTSYMILNSRYDFFGGYDHARGAGFVHVADRHIAPGKKQWTWGHHAFGRAWDRELADDAAPYIELMAGLYTDNQPDFSYLGPYETRTFSHFYWPIQDIGPVQNASTRAALRLVVGAERRIELGAAAPAEIAGARILLRHGERVLLDARADLGPGRSWRNDTVRFGGDRASELTLSLFDAAGAEILAYRPEPDPGPVEVPVSAVEPASPQAAGSVEELFLIGEHLDQYRHPTRAPEAYWQEALARDPLDVRSHLGLARRLLERARFDEAREHCEAACRRLTHWHPNSYTGEAHYLLGVALSALDVGRSEEAYDAFHRAAWDHAWRGAAEYELSRLDTRGRRWDAALAHLDRALTANPENNHAAVLRAAVLRTTEQLPRAKEGLLELLSRDPLEHWARIELARLDAAHEGEFLALCRNDAQTIIDLCFDYADAGLHRDALSLLELHHRSPSAPGATPNPLARTLMTHFIEAWLWAREGDAERAATTLTRAQVAPPDYAFPSRPREARVLEWALRQPGSPRNAAFALGNLYYDFGRHEEAIVQWERAISADPVFPTALRNLGIAYWNVRGDGGRAREMYARAFAANPGDARVLFEWDQLRKKLNDPPAERLAHWLQFPELRARRDDASIELAALYNLTGQPEKALDLLEHRRFHPWEGGEGQVLLQYRTARLALGVRALAAHHAAQAADHFEKALTPPENLGETYHPHQSKSDILHGLGHAHRARGDEALARRCFEESAEGRGDFQQMAVTEHSEHSYHRAMSLRALGREEEAQRVFRELGEFARQKKATPAKIDYFATSLPLLLVFDDDLQRRNDWEADYLAGLAALGLGEPRRAAALFEAVLEANRAHQGALDALRSITDR